MCSLPNFTELLAQARAGDEVARDQLLTAAYDELRLLADAFLARERRNHTLQATALVHELCVGMLKNENLPRGNRVQFRAFVAQAMRHILIDNARARGRLKRGGDRQRQEFDEQFPAASDERSIELLGLDEALSRLAELDPRKSRVVELKYFGDLQIDEIARVLGVSSATVKRDWEVARTWLRHELSKGESV